jgi:zinc protease
MRIDFRLTAKAQRRQESPFYCKTLRLCAFAVVGLLLVAAPAQAGLPIQTWQMDNGTRVYFVENHDLPLLDVSLEFPAGTGQDGKANPAVASLTQGLLTLGAGGMGEEEISRRLADVGAVLGGNLDQDRAGLRLRTLSSERERVQALAVMAKVAQFPDFPEAALQREKNRAIAELKEYLTHPEVIASRALGAMIYGSHPYGLSARIEPDSIAAVRREDLVAFHRAHYRADQAVVALIGDISTAQARAIASQLTGALPRAESAPQPQPPVTPPKEETRRIAHPASQSHILIGQPGVTRNDPDYFPLYVGNYVLGGGGFASRLLEEVRQKRGLVYSVYSYFMPLQQQGPFEIGLQTKREQADQALAVVRQTLQDFIAQGPTESELKQAKQNLVGGFPLRLDSNKKILEYLAVIGYYQLPLTYLDDFPGKVEKVTVAQVKEAFTRRIRPENLVTVVVGTD